MRAIPLLLLAAALSVQAQLAVPRTPAPALPAESTAKLAASLAAARAHRSHVWRDTRPIADDGTVTAYVEIPTGERRKFEFDMRNNARAIDRVLPASVGGYPINYGFVPQTVFYDGDPFDALVLGPTLRGGQLVRGAVIGVMFMEDNGDVDSKVVLSPIDSKGAPRYSLTDAIRKKVADYFERYKRHQAGATTRVPGWGTAAEGFTHVQTAHAFFRECASAVGRCVLK